VYAVILLVLEAVCHALEHGPEEVTEHAIISLLEKILTLNAQMKTGVPEMITVTVQEHVQTMAIPVYQEQSVITSAMTVRVQLTETA
jgi:hypothetical protein